MAFQGHFVDQAVVINSAGQVDTQGRPLGAVTLGGVVSGGGQQVNNVIIGTVTPLAGSFTTLVASGLITATGGQIAFPAIQAASADANTLDDYEEGTWTPTDDSGAGLSLTVTNATYTKLGRKVFLQFSITYPVTANGNSASLAGFPFNSSAAGSRGKVGYSDVALASFSYLNAASGTSVALFTPGVNVINSTMSAKIVTATVEYEV